MNPRVPPWLRPSRRRAIIWAAVILLAAGVGSLATALVAVSHYRAEHASALRDRAAEDSLVAESDRLRRVANERQARIAALAAQVAAGKGRLERMRVDLRFAIVRFKRLRSQVETLRSQASALRGELAAARATSKAEYDRGYEAGLADGQSAVDGGGGSDDCDPNYEGACVPASSGDVDCGELLETDFSVVGVDVDGLDGDGDGVACES
jgi:TolA-binding protein